MRLIDADALLRRMERDPLFDLIERYGVSGVIEAEPTADAKPVRHGKWLPRESNVLYPFWERYTCSECGKHSDDTRYCPNCGAVMDSNSGHDPFLPMDL